jgi:hypothetical protein
MLNSSILDLAVGLTLIFGLMAMLSSSFKECLALPLGWRPRHLVLSVRHLVGDEDGTGLSADLYRHPLIRALAPPPGGLVGVWYGLLKKFGVTWMGCPDNIPSDTFAAVLIELTSNPFLMQLLSQRRGVGKKSTLGNRSLEFLDSLRIAMFADVDQAEALLASATAEQSKNPLAPDALKTLADAFKAYKYATSSRPSLADDMSKLDTPLRNVLVSIRCRCSTLQEFETGVGAWFDKSMDPVSDSYKTKARYALFLCGLILSVLLNVDAVAITDHLWLDKHLRDSVATAAQVQSGGGAPHVNSGSGVVEQLNSTAAQLSGLQLPIGWGSPSVDQGWTFSYCLGFARKQHVLGLWLTVIGWLITALTASLGAPFWFDAMNQVLSIVPKKN